jgi:hypothetical protein
MTIDPRTVPVRFSNLKRMAQSPLHYWDAVQSETESTPSMRIGTLAHSLLFPGSAKYLVWDSQRRGNDWKEFRANHSGPIFTKSEVDKAIPIAEAIAKHRDAAPLLVGNCEKTINWSWNGRKCRSTPDVWSATHIPDVKTARTSKPDAFMRSASWMAYHAQLAFYDMAVGTHAKQLDRWRDLYIIAVESKRPYPVTVLKLTDRARQEGEKLCRLWFEQLLACEADNSWPGYAQSVVDFDIAPMDEGEFIFGDEEAAE